MKRTEEQQTIIDHVTSTEGLTKVSAVAGSGKTTLLVEVAKALPIRKGKGLYLAYNKAIATEAKGKFPAQKVQCLTTHSLAFRAVKELGYQLDLEDRITYRVLPSNISYENRCAIIYAIDHFCLSEYTSFEAFAKKHTKLPPKAIEAGEELLNNMAEGKAISHHGFYLKLFHILLADGDIKYDDFDFIALDEAGDINLVTLEIFKLLPAKNKLMVGDPHQNIYSFNRTINCFQVMKDEGELFSLSQSFRVSYKIADKIQNFCTSYLHEDMVFKGVKVDEDEIRDEAFISRTNASLIARMIQLNRLNIPYNLTRSPDVMFKVLRMLCLLKPNSYVSIPEYTYLQKDVDEYHRSIGLQKLYKSHLAFIKAKYEDDPSLSGPLQTIFNYGTKTILECYHTAKKYKASRVKHKITLGTAHSTKGLEFDRVELAADMNTAISDIIADLRNKKTSPELLTIDERTELNLYYVAASRARKQLIGAVYL